MSTSSASQNYKDVLFRAIISGFLFLSLLNYFLSTQDIWFGKTLLLDAGQGSMAFFLPHLTVAWVVISLFIAIFLRFQKPVSLVVSCFFLTTLPMLFAMTPPVSAADVILQR